MVFLQSTAGGTKTKTIAVSKGRNEITVIVWDMSNVYQEFKFFVGNSWVGLGGVRRWEQSEAEVKDMKEGDVLFKKSVLLEAEEHGEAVGAG